MVEVEDNATQSDNVDRDSLEEFVTKEAEITEEEAEKLLGGKANVYIDIDGKWKLELDDNGLNDETDDHTEESISKVDKDTDAAVEQEEEDENFEVKWCTPVAVRSDDSSSEDEKGKSYVPAPQRPDHKFSDGIVWETIEELDEEETESEVNIKPLMNDVQEVSEKGMEKQKLVHVSPRPHPTHPVSSVKGMKHGEEEGGMTGPTFHQLTEVEGLPTRTAEIIAARSLQSENTFWTEKIMKPDEYEAMHEEMANISVRNLASFWETLSKQLEGKTVRHNDSPTIKKKWSSMPELKVVKRKMPEAPTQQKIRKIENDPGIEVDIVKSDSIVNDVDLCRSVSIKDRKVMFESLDRQSKREKMKQWSSMPSLKPERKLPSLEKNKVRWDDGKVQEWPEEIRPRSQATMRNVPDHGFSLARPQSPLLVTNEVRSPGRDEVHSSSDSVCSSLTSSSTVVPTTTATDLISLLDDSAGEIYTGAGQETQLFVVENGTEVPLTPLSIRKTLFESGDFKASETVVGRQSRSWEGAETASRRSSGIYRDVEGEEEGHKVFQNTSVSLPLEMVKSSTLAYIEEEKDVLQNINIVKSVKQKFLRP